MQLSLKACALAAGCLWGGAILFVGLIHLVSPGYGIYFLQMVASVYPWFHASGTFGDILIGAFDGLIDGAIAGVLFAWIYNMAAGRVVHAVHTEEARPVQA